MSVQDNKALVRTYFDTIWNKGEFEREPEFVAKDVVVHAPPIPGIPEGIGGPLAIVGAFCGKGLPDLHLTQDLIFGGEDKVVQYPGRPGERTPARTCSASLPPVPSSSSPGSTSSGSRERQGSSSAGERWT